MAESNFVDYVKIYCRSGKGGRGSMHLRHVKYNPNGGPDGGDGGHGGSIYLRGNHNYWTLLHLKFQRHVFAEHGGNGGRDKCHGKDGECFCCFDRDYEKYDFCMELPIGLSIKPIKKHKG